MKTFAKTTTAILFAAASYTSHAQDFGNILSVGAENAETYLTHYAGPAINSFGNGMAEGWYNTGKTHSPLGFNLTISPSFSFIPESEQMFRFVESDYQDMVLEGDADGLLPTLVGGDAESGSELVFSGEATYPGVSGVAFDGEQRFAVPDGVINLKNVPFGGTPAPTFNIGLGIYKGTELKVRFLPEVTSGDFGASMFGLGVQHDIKQWIPGIKNLPFDLSGLVAVSNLKLTYDIDVNTGEFSGEGEAIFNTTSTTVQAIVSKKLLFFTPYFSLGFNAVKSSLDVKGDYTYSTITSETEIKDPIALDFEGAGGLRSTLGARVQLAVLTLHAAYTLQKYNTFSTGIGISIR